MQAPVLSSTYFISKEFAYNYLPLSPLFCNLLIILYLLLIFCIYYLFIIDFLLIISH